MKKNNYMSDDMFNELVISMKEAAAISKGEMQPSRVFDFSPIYEKEVREKTHKNQDEFTSQTL